MKKYQIINFHHLLSQIDLQKVDKESRTKLINLDILLGDIVESHNAEINKVKARLSKGHDEEIRQVSELVAQIQKAKSDEERNHIRQEIEKHTAYGEIQSQLNEEVNKRMMEDVEIEFDKVSAEDLAQWCADSGTSITLNLLREFRRAGFTY